MEHTLIIESLRHQRFALTEGMHAKWKAALVENRETQQEWFTRKVQEEIAAHGHATHHPPMEGAE